MHARMCGPKSLLTTYNTKLLIKPDFPSLADEIAEQHPDMDIRVTAFTVSEKSSNTLQFCNVACQFAHNGTEEGTSAIWASSRENLSSGFPTKRVSNQPAQLQRLARKLIFRS